MTPVADVGQPQSTIQAYDAFGKLITLNQNMIPGSVRVMRLQNTGGDRTVYSLQITEGGGSFVKDGKNLGVRVQECYNVRVWQDSGGADGAFTGWAAYTFNWRTDKNMTVQKNFQRDTQFSSYGFEMTIVPSISNTTTTLAINMVNVSLLGFPENASGGPGRPRTMRSEMNTTVMVDNKTDTFMIGGVDKGVTSRSVSKVPWLGSLPLIGYIFASESEVTRKSPLVAVVQCRHQAPLQPIESHEIITIKSVEKSLRGVDKGVTYGYDQFLLDKKKTRLQSLP